MDMDIMYIQESATWGSVPRAHLNGSKKKVRLSGTK